MGQEEKWVKSEIVILYHDALKSGKHWDIRIKDPKTNMWHSWAIKIRGKFTRNDVKVSKNPKHPTVAIKTTMHTEEEAKFEGEIPKGSYGAGSLQMILNEGVLITYHPKKFFKILFKSGKYAGQTWIFFRMSGAIWILFAAKKQPQENTEE